MNMSTRAVVIAVTVGSLAAPVALARAIPAAASGKPTNCTVVSTTYPGITTRQKFSVGDAGTAVVRRDDVNDGLIVRKVVAHKGWAKSSEFKTGPKVSVEFQNKTTKVELEAAQSAQYYGPDVLVVEIKTCQR